MEEFKVGEEVIYNGRKFVVTKYLEKTLLYMLHPSGATTTIGYPTLKIKGLVRKTGKTYPELTKIFEELEDGE